MRKIFDLKSFWIVFLLSSGVIFVALLNFNRIYVSESQVLVIPKTGSAADSSQMVENIKEISYSLPFLNRMVEENPDVAVEEVKEMTPAKKRAYWRNHLAVERLGESGILKITGKDESRYRAETLSAQVPKTLVGMAGHFYNIQSEVDIRITDGPVTDYGLAVPTYILFLQSLVFGFLLATFSFSVSFLTFGEKKTGPTGKKPDWPAFRYDRQERDLPPIFPVEETWTYEKKKTPVKKTETIVHGKKAAAPDNLPVAPENLPVAPAVSNKTREDAVANEKKEPVKKDEKLDQPIIREATPEEVKERLNKLLSGKF